jgi:hypothetical protein
MALLRRVQHGGLGLRGLCRLPPVGSRNPPSTHQGSGIRQSRGIPEAFREPCSGARRTASAAIPDFRIRAFCRCNALSLRCVCAVLRRRTDVPLCFTGLPRIGVPQAVRNTHVVGPHAGTSQGFLAVCWCVSDCWRGSSSGNLSGRRISACSSR